MKRFFGMMPSSEIGKEGSYIDNFGMNVNIDAGPHGWTIHWADASCTYRDEDNTTEVNFKTAYDTANEKVGPLKEVEKSGCKVVNKVTPMSQRVSSSCEACGMDVD